MSDIKPDTFPKAKLHPLLAQLPDHLKDPANYEKVQKTILQSFMGKHSHGEVLEWATCKDCQKLFATRRTVLKKLGFKNAAQYMAWKKVHEVIRERVPLR